jgi:predicted PurR-regulated permease PerM
MDKFQADIPTKTIVKFWAILATFLLGGLLIFQSIGALVTVLVGVFLAIVLNRPVDFFETKLGGRNRSITVVLLTALVVIVTCVLVVVPYFITQIGGFLVTLPGAIQRFATDNFLLDFLKQFGLDSEYDKLLGNLQSAVYELIASLPNSLASFFGGLANMLITLLTVIVLTILTLVEGDTWLERWWRIAYKNDRTRKTHQAIAIKMYEAISGYVAGTLIIALLNVAVVAIGALILSMFTPIPGEIFLPLSFIMFLCSFIPMFGGLIGTVIIEVLLILYSFPAFLIFLIYLLVTQMINSNVIVPLIFNRTVKISPLTVLVAITFGGFLGGVIGVLVSIPVAACVQVGIQEYINSKKYHGII